MIRRSKDFVNGKMYALYFILSYNTLKKIREIFFWHVRKKQSHNINKSHEIYDEANSLKKKKKVFVGKYVDVIDDIWVTSCFDTLKLIYRISS